MVPMTELSNADLAREINRVDRELAVAIARVEGKLDSLAGSTSLRLDDYARRLEDSRSDRTALHTEIERRVTDGEARAREVWQAIGDLRVWRGRVIGMGAGMAALLALLQFLLAVYRPHLGG